MFGDRGRPLPVVAAKGHCGNLGAGSGMIEVIAGVMALNRQRLFSVLNYQTPDPECRLRVVAGENEDAVPGRSFIHVSVTPQGQASAVSGADARRSRLNSLRGRFTTRVGYASA